MSILRSGSKAQFAQKTTPPARIPHPLRQKLNLIPQSLIPISDRATLCNIKVALRVNAVSTIRAF
jgi:hypothetical protein